MMRVQVDAPRWARFRVLAWLARKVGIARKWEASGRYECDLLADLHRLGRRRGFTVVWTDQAMGFQLVFLDDRCHAVTSYGSAS